MNDRITVFTRANLWIGLPRLYKPLRDCGFDIDLICLEGSFARNSDYLDRVITLSPDDSDQAWVDKLLSCPGEKLLLGDDQAVDWLLRTTEKNSDLATYIESRLSKLESIATARIKYRLARLGVDLDIPVPAFSPLNSSTDTGDLLSKYGWPLVFKSSFGFAGQGVFVCRSLRDIRRAKEALRLDSQAFVQRYVAGIPIMISVSCDRGRVLAKIAAVKRATWPPETGPSTIVEIENHPVAEGYVDKLVTSLGLSGIISFDFLMDLRGNYWLMECNLRPVPISHYGAVLVDTWLNNRETSLPLDTRQLVALYPQSIMNPVDAELFSSAVLDDDLADIKLAHAYENLIANTPRLER
jgi:hypothetical protein